MAFTPLAPPLSLATSFATFEGSGPEASFPWTLKAVQIGTRGLDLARWKLESSDATGVKKGTLTFNQTNWNKSTDLMALRLGASPTGSVSVTVTITCAGTDQPLTLTVTN